MKGARGLLLGLFAALTTFLLGRTGLSFQRIGGLILNSFTLRRRGDKLHLFWIAALHSSLLMFVHKAQVGLIIFVVREFGCKGKQNLAQVDKGVRAALLIALFPGLNRISCNFLQLTLHLFFTAPHVRLELLIAPLVLRNESLQPSAFCDSLHPPAKPLAMNISSSDTFGGGGQVLGLDYVLDQRKPNGSTLIKLTDGRAGKEEVAPATLVGVPAVLEIVGCPDRAVLIGQSSLPSGARGPRPRSCQVAPRSSASYRPVNSQWASSRGVQGRAPVGRSSVSVRMRSHVRKSDGHILYLFGLLGHEKLPLLLSLMLSSGCHLFRGGIPGLKHYQPSPRLICIKQTGGQVSTKHRRLNALSDILTNKKAGRSEEEVVRKELQFREPVERLSIARPAPSPLRPLR
ncbi:LOW QUALITY PROTEIN: hypothetical protein Cgig2_005305 [Carnegiea gigantea]|uniref:Uncharacterized protein n=1 Tax=Carnegiea gigantea TaxID=171969 RepID=A0A9Q1QAP3_9CARY|nr:LOW QUALITY PROTEIN: hypothetical protein Cgig2_005305 [Carnegiea gigantea]